MNLAQGFLVLYGVAVVWALPGMLRRARWPLRAPRAAIALWLSLLLSPAVALALTAHQVLAPEGHADIGLSDWLSLSGTSGSADTAGHLQLLTFLLAVFGVLGAIVAHGVVRAARARGRHREALRMVARPSTHGGWWELDDDRPIAYCVAGDGGDVVISRGALAVLPPACLGAVLAHERAHLTGRHHLLSAGTHALARLMPWLPLTHHADDQIPLLLEIAADDAAEVHCGAQTLALALAHVALADDPPPTSQGTLQGANHAAVARVRRLLAAHGRLPGALRMACWSAAFALPLVPFLFACAP